MSIQFVCPNCTQVLKLPDHLKGMNYSCPRCGTLTHLNPDGTTVRAGKSHAQAAGPAQAGSDGWYALIDDARYGPYSTAQVCGYIGGGKIAANTPVWREGMAGWASAGECEEFREAFSTLSYDSSASDEDPYAAVETAASDYGYSRVKRRRGSGTNPGVYVGIFVAIVVLGGLLVWVVNRPVPEPTEAVRQPTRRVVRRPRPRPRPKQSPTRPRRTGGTMPRTTPTDDGNGETAVETPYSRELFEDEDDAVSFASVSEASIKDLPDISLTMDGKQVPIAKLWKDYQALIDKYERALGELRMTQERLDYVITTKKLSAQDEAARKAEYRTSYRDLQKRREDVLNKARREYEIAKSRYEDAKEAEKQGGSRLVLTTAKHRLEEAIKKARLVQHYDPKSEKKWAELFQELKDRYAKAPGGTDQPEEKLPDVGDLTRQRNALRERVEELTEDVQKFNKLFEKHLIDLLATGVLRVKANYRVDNDQVQVTGGRWVLVRPGSEEYNRLVREEIMRIVEKSEELKRMGRGREAELIFKLIEKRFPGSPLPTEEQEPAGAWQDDEYPF